MAVAVADAERDIAVVDYTVDAVVNAAAVEVGGVETEIVVD